MGQPALFELGQREGIHHSIISLVAPRMLHGQQVYAGDTGEGRIHEHVAHDLHAACIPLGDAPIERTASECPVEIGDFAHVPGGNSLVECAIGKHQGHAKDTASVPAGYVTIERTSLKRASKNSMRPTFK